ncbi:uncharacterized protein [Oscarella lobularis]|uniref:uncharacterized protein isoform X2 n=1 Tax=Oscarella lobularis TaxID=121494 RepID=UPI0033144456
MSNEEYIYDNSPQRWEETAASACTNALLLRGLTIKCRMTHKEEEKATADGILLNRFVPLRYRDQLKRYHDRQVLFVLNMEGEKEKEWSDPQLTNMWDFKIGYRLDSDLPLLYGCGDFDGIDIVGSLLRKYDAGEIVPPKHRTGLVAMISNCQKVANNRLTVLKAFMNASKVKVFSYGHCENNMKTQQTRFNNPNWHSMKLEIFQQHKFGMAYESKNIDQYVTEKIYSCLATGVIPIYHGASDVHLFVPKRSYIDASKFGSVQELIAHVEKVDNDPQLYASYFQWDVTNLRLLHRNYCYAPVHCRWCERVAQIRDNKQ